MSKWHEPCIERRRQIRMMSSATVQHDSIDNTAQDLTVAAGLLGSFETQISTWRSARPAWWGNGVCWRSSPRTSRWGAWQCLTVTRSPETDLYAAGDRIQQAASGRVLHQLDPDSIVEKIYTPGDRSVGFFYTSLIYME